MQDPFPFSAPTWLVNVTSRLSSPLGLPVLDLHIHEVLLAALTYHTICTVVSPKLSSAVFPKIYPKLTGRNKLNWDIHVTSLFQSCLVSVIGLWQITYHAERKAMDWRDRVYAYDGALGFLVALAVGYFFWDLLMSAYYVSDFGVGSLAHAASALAVYGFGFRPVVNWYAPVFILFELSTPFLNFHWFLDKLGMTGSDPQLYNGVVLMSTFFGSRLVWGSYNCFRVFPDMLKALAFQNTAAGQAWLRSEAATAAVDAAAHIAAGDPVRAALRTKTAPVHLPTWVAGVYLGSYSVLMLLNVHWFGRMVATIRARFDPPFGTRGVKPSARVAVSRSVDVDGATAVEVDAKEVRQRRTRRA